ncbi:MFS transporter [Sphingomonas flavalba]|uniref:MFS transporter n=1 Tax=Sphingomonas flavalba TaxID=2559804 RepID=UPI00109DC53A|nr:MFS transporter [Sphingomonas flavalba]
MSTINGAIGDHVSPATTRRVLLLCGLAILAEGYDVGVMGAAILSLSHDPAFAIGDVGLGLLASCALAGMMIGAPLMGMIGERVERRGLLAICVAVFSASMIGCALSESPWQFGLFRFLGGIGMGGVIPLSATLTIEYSPLANRARNYGLMYSGYGFGIMLVAVVAISVIPAWGWRGLFWLGAVPLAMAPFLWRALPQSFEQLARAGHTGEAIAAGVRLGAAPAAAEWLAGHARPMAAADTAPEVGERNALFSAGRARATIAFWSAIAIGLLLVYGLGSWLPRIMREQGMAVGSSLGMLAAFSLSGALGGIVGGWLADRLGNRRTIAASYALAAFGIVAFGQSTSIGMTYALAALVGYGTVATTLVLTAWITAWYPASIRTGAVGWALGVGRIGAIAGPTIGGVLLAITGGDVVQITGAFAAFAGLAAIAVLFVPDRAGANDKP